MTDHWLFEAEVSLIVGALVLLILWRLMRALDGRGHTASIRLPIGAGLLLRLLAIVVAAAVPAIGHKLTSTDEATFLATTKALAALPLSSSKWLSMGLHWTEVIPWALTYKLFGSCGTLPLRLEQIGLSLGAVVLISATAGKLGGRRAALITAWIAALEPSSAYFSGLLHQESLCMVGEALLLGALVDAWMRDGDRWRPLPCGLVGLGLIFGTRSYLAFFAAVAGALVLVASVLARRVDPMRGLIVLSACALAAVVAGSFAAPHVVPGAIAGLQHQLNLPYPGANLPLPHATVTSGGGLLKTVVLHSLDLIFRPYPWQLGSAAQKAAVAGTLIWYLLVLATLWLTLRQGLDARLLPALILIACETVGFALTLVDAGEGFRHRVNLLLLLAVPLGVMLERWWTARGRRIQTAAVT
ncbi:MAG TPA: glycosyltransferase family 39 protein [Solirubrobacteraceae bacterium]|nr:glycosyltransferase family 39 protein [Solirubrobacteraceae bacterium]